jgi:hypothetical protein
MPHTGDMTIRLSPAEYSATTAKIAKINERAAKRGFTGRITVTAAKVESTETDTLGFKRTTVVYDVEIGGEAPSYNGWTFLARIDRLGETFTIAAAPGVERVDRSVVRVGECDHCGQSRHRNNTYLVVNADGEVRNVGSTCIKDFLGWSGSVVFFSTDEIGEEIEGLRGNYGVAAYSVPTVLAIAYAVIRACGWVPASAWDRTPTRSIVHDVLDNVKPKRSEDRALFELITVYAGEANELADTLRAWVLSDEFGGDNGYVENLKVAAGVEYVTSKQLGLLVSAPQAYIRFQETAAERAAKEALWAAEKVQKATSAFVGAVKERITISGTVSAIRYISGQFGVTTLYTITGDDGNLFKWFASQSVLGDDAGVHVTITGTVKKHDEYNGTKSTVLTRCKEVAA